MKLLVSLFVALALVGAPAVAKEEKATKPDATKPAKKEVKKHKKAEGTKVPEAAPAKKDDKKKK